MNIFDLFDQNACSIWGKNNGLESWTWEEYKEKKHDLGNKIVLVDMINHPIEWSIPISDELFSGKYPEWTIFVLYCHSWWSSWYLQMQLAPQIPQYTFVNMLWGIMSLDI